MCPMGGGHSRMRWGRFVQRPETFGKAAKMLRNDLREEETNKYFTCLLFYLPNRIRIRIS